MEIFDNNGNNNQQTIDWEEKFKKSGMTIDEWNKSILDARDAEIAKQIEKSKQERIEVEQKIDFIVREIKHKGAEEATRIIAEAEKYGQKLMMDAKQYRTDLLSGKNPSQPVSISSTSIMDTNYINNLNNLSKSWVENSKTFVEAATLEAEEKYNRFITERDKQKQQDQLQRQTQFNQQQVNIKEHQIEEKSR